MNASYLKKATVDSPDPTPAYLYNEIAKMTAASFQVSKQVEDWLMNKLRDKSPHVKRKVLLIIKHTCLKGPSDFKRGIAMRSEDIRDAANFRGDYDPLVGDAYNQRVRDAAKEVLECLYDKTPSEATTSKPLIGFGSGAFPSYSSSSSASSSPSSYSNSFNSFNQTNSSNAYSNYISSGIDMTSKTAGFGNPEFNRPKPQKIGVVTEVLATSLTGVAEVINKIIPGSEKSALTAFPGGTPYTSHHEYNKNNFIPPVVPTTSNYYNANNDSNADKRLENGMSSWGLDEKSTRADDSGNYESKIVDDFTASGGIRAAPKREELNQFCTRCANCNSALVAEYLDNKLESANWQVRLKALHGIEALLKANNQAVRDYFTENYENLEENKSSVQSTVKTRSQKILKMLGRDSGLDDASEGSPETTRVKATTKEQGSTNLLSLDDDDNNTSGDASNATNVIVEADGDMFGGLVLNTTTTTTAASKKTTTATTSTVAKKPPQQINDDSTSEMFSNLSIHSGSPSLNKKQPATAAKAKSTTTTTTTAAAASNNSMNSSSSNSLLDFFDTPTPSTTAAALFAPAQPLPTTITTAAPAPMYHHYPPHAHPQLQPGYYAPQQPNNNNNNNFNMFARAVAAQHQQRSNDASITIVPNTAPKDSFDFVKQAINSHSNNKN